MSVNAIENVWDRVDIGDPDDCWVWQGAIATGGYGLISIGGRDRRAHRIAYQASTGADPGDMFVCHTCDNPRCCNPAHLFLGTPADNMHDAQRKGRLVAPRGERHGMARLTESEVIEIRRRHANGEQRRDLANTYGVSPSAITRAVTGANWGHIAKEGSES